MLRKLKGLFYRVEKLNIRIEYDNEKGISVQDFAEYLLSIEKGYSRFSSKKASLSIIKVKEGSIDIEFIQTVIVPVMQVILANGVYDFGQSIIESVAYVKSKPDKFLEGIKDKLPKCINIAINLNFLFNFGKHNTINQITITPSKGDGSTADPLSVGRDEASKLLALSAGVKDNELIPALTNDSYNTVKLKFDTASRFESDKPTYKGTIKEIDPDIKKVDFATDAIKEQFDFTNHPFDNTYEVDIEVVYNPNGKSISKYIITMYHGIYIPPLLTH